MANRLRNAALVTVSFAIFVTSEAIGQYCPVGTTYFAGNFSRAGCTVGTCWASSPFSGSIAITGSQYPSTNYTCATTSPAAGAQENTLYTHVPAG